MTATAIEGVVAAGRVPTWIIPAATITTDPVTGTWSIPLAELNDAGNVKVDCYLDAGDIQISRTANTRTRQRLCQTVQETINITLSAVYDQQDTTTDVNDVYDALAEDADVYIAQAFGWDSTATPTTATVIDLWKGSVQMVAKNQPTSPDEDLKFTATISGSAYFADVALTAA
jgi:tRNA A37 threonylcarbamoyladenosine synthetase subunit TsaC/SUA5/YrdC